MSARRRSLCLTEAAGGTGVVLDDELARQSLDRIAALDSICHPTPLAARDAILMGSECGFAFKALFYSPGQGIISLSDFERDAAGLVTCESDVSR
jgi:hypothetical protein